MKRSSLNHAYRLVWNEATNTFVAVAETTKARGKRASAGVALTTVLLAGSATAAGLPSGGQIVGGTGSIEQTANTLTVNQTSARLAADWQSFNIGAGNTVNFVQPSSTSVALNRVLGADVSVIQGALKANGQVFLVNPNGVLFTPSAQVNVGGIVASTLNISTADFMAGNYQFAGSSSNAIVNQGHITAANGGSIALIAAKITNTGSLNAHQGNVLLGAGSAVTLDLGGPVKLQVTQAAIDTLIENGGAIAAAGGVVYLSAQAASELASSTINNGGLVEANTISASGKLVNNTGKLQASSAGSTPGSVHIEASQVLVHTGNITAPNISANVKNLVDAGHWDASAASNASTDGGHISIHASERALQTTAAQLNADATPQGTGGSIRMQAQGSALLSGSASAQGQTGGDIAATAPSLVLAGAKLNASGSAGGGRIRVGGGWQGKDADLANANSTTLSDTHMDVSASQSGNAGTAVIWSEKATQFGGSIQATGGVSGGNGGQVEVSSHGSLAFGGKVDASAAKGNKGQLLLDPKNIEIVASVSSLNVLSLLDPTPTAGEAFGSGNVFELKNNGVGIDRIVVASANDSTGGTNAGAVYLFNSQTGALISTLLGSSANDKVGSFGITALTNGNFVVRSPDWANGTKTRAGAVTWGNGNTGISGTVSSSNSLVGSTTSDQVGTGIVALTNGNYVVNSPNWDNGSIVDAGAVTWGNGSSGISGVVSNSNSLVGSNTSDGIGSSGVYALTNGNYVVSSSNWKNGTVAYAGAITWGNGTTGITGAVNSSNSLVGSSTNDQLGNSAITTLTNGNYVVKSSNWTNGAATGAGAVTWGNGTTGTTGAVSSQNSLVGSTTGDNVGSNGITELTNGNYVVKSSNWKNGTVAGAGAVTWGNGTTGTAGAVSSQNSLVGSSTGDSVGNAGVLALKNNGNYVVISSIWKNGAATNAGAVTWGSGTAGVTGPITSGNSLVGSNTNDKVGGLNGVTPLTNGNYVVNASNWANGTATRAGAATWGNGTTGITGVITSTNSLVGSNTGDQVGSVTIPLTNGNYVVNSPNWANGTATTAGAVTWGNGTTGITGAITSTNSLVGTITGDMVGSGGVTALTNGNYVVGSSGWNNGTTTKVGAATWGNGTTGITGPISSSNSLVGGSANDLVSYNGVRALTNGNYVVRSSTWANGTATRAGAATWGNGTTGITGTVSSSNSLVGSSANDLVSNSGVTALTNGDYVVSSYSWANGPASAAGAATLGSGTSGISGVVSSSNSLVGNSAYDRVGTSVTALSDGRALIKSTQWNSTTPALSAAGRVDILSPGTASGTPLTNPHTFALDPSGKSTLLASDLTALLNAGTAVTLQANNDITVSTAVTANNPAGNGGALTLQAGRSIAVNASITTDNSNLTAVAGDPGAIAANRDAGTSTLTLGSGASINAGTGVVNLVANGGNFVNNSGSSTPITASRTFIYSSAPSTNTLGGMTVANKHYNESYSGTTPAYASSGDWFFYSVVPKLLVAPGTQTIAYGDSAPASYTSTTSGFIDGDTLTSAGISGTAAFTTGGANSTAGKLVAGGHDVSYNSGLLSSLGYGFADNTASVNELTVTKKALTGTLAAGSSSYGATLSPGATSLTGVITGDVVTPTVTVNTTGNTSTSGQLKAGSYTGIQSVSALGGADGANYSIGTTIGDYTVSKATLSGTITAGTSVYGSPLVAGTVNLTGKVTGDVVNTATVTINTTGNTSTSNNLKAGSHTGIQSVSGTLSGADAANYNFAGATGDYTVSKATLNGMIFPGNSIYGSPLVAGTVNLIATSKVAGDDVTALAKNISINTTGKTSTAGHLKAGNYTGIQSLSALSGVDAANYSFAAITGGYIVTPKFVTVNAGNVSKVYDGTTAMTGVSLGVNGTLTNDVVSVGGTGTFTSKNAGINLGYTINQLALSGADASNYFLSGGSNANGSNGVITKANLTVTGLVANNKVYDTSTNATLSGTATVTAFRGDSVSVGGTASGSFADKNVGTAKAITVSGNTLTGADAGNYTLVQQSGLSADITPASLTVSGLVANSKVYDASTTATLSGTASVTALAGDSVSVGGTATGTFADKNAGPGKAVTVSGNTLTGTDAGNYTLVQQSGLSASITRANLAVTGLVANNRVYDPTTAASLSGTATVAAFKGDSVSVGGTAIGSFADKNVGTSKAVTVSGNTLTGADAGNYNLVQQSGLSANITPASVTVAGLSASSKVYDASTTATLSGTATVTPLRGDNVSVSGTASGSFADKNAGPGKTVTVSGNTLSGPDAGNYTLLQQSGLSANITPASLTLTGVVANNKVYDGSTIASLSNSGSLTGVLSGDTVTASNSGATFADKNVGTAKTVTLQNVTLTGTDAGNYSVSTTATTKADITKANLAVTGLVANNRVYNPTTAASLSGTATVAGFKGDSVSVSGTAIGNFADKHVGTGKAVTVSGNTFSGADAGNYNLVQQSGLSADITPANLTVTGLTANSKVYDASTQATLSGTATVTAFKGDSVSVSGTASGSFADKNVGTGKAVTVSGNTLTGTDAGNYTLVQQGGLSANITPASLAVTGLTANSKVYDASTQATLNGTATVAAFKGDNVSIGGTASGTFADKNVGTGKAVTVSGNTLTGADAGNYTLVQQGGLSADITKANLAVTGLVANNRVYDTLTAANLGGTATVAAFKGDSVSVGGTASGSFADKNAGTAKAVTVSGNTLTGADAGNYTLVQQSGLSADITPANLAVRGLTANSKVYDANTNATLSGTATVVALGQDQVTLGGTASGSFADKNVGTAKAVTVSGNTISGADAGNYTLVQQGGLSADITPANLAVTGLVASNKVYDASTKATLSGTATVAAFKGDSVSVGGTASATFADKNVGTAKAVTVTGNTISGADAGNYTLAQQKGLKADITQASLTVTGLVVSSKVYDGNTSASVSNAGSLSGVLSGDSVTASNSGASFVDKNAGTHKAVTLKGVTLTGTDAGNYSVAITASTTADITPKPITVQASAPSKTYDSTNTSTATLTGSGVIAGDTVSFSHAGATFADKNAGVGKTVTVSGISASGGDAANYSVNTTASTTADISKAKLSVTGLVAQDKTFDGSTAATLSGTPAVLPLGKDSVTVGGTPGGIFADSAVGTGKAVSVSGNTLVGADAGNYTLAQQSGLKANINNVPFTPVTSIFQTVVNPPIVQPTVPVIQTPAFQPPSTPPGTHLNGGLAFVNVPASGGTGASSPDADLPSAPPLGSQFSSSGFMPVLVVGGGIRMPGQTDN